MDTKIDKTPRQLARDYYNGLLSFAEYRDLRRRLIEDITRVDATRPLTISADPEATTQEFPRKSPVVPPPATGNKTGKRLLPAAALVLVAVVAGWLLLSTDREQGRVTDEAGTGDDVAIDEPGSEQPAAPVLDEFLAADDWSYDALAGLTLAWSTLQDQEQQAARQTQPFRVLSERLRERVLEQRALLEIDSEAAERAQVLLSLAGHLGITGMDYAAAPPGESAAGDSEVLAAAPAPVPADDLHTDAVEQLPAVPAAEAPDASLAARFPDTGLQTGSRATAAPGDAALETGPAVEPGKPPAPGEPQLSALPQPPQPPGKQADTDVSVADQAGGERAVAAAAVPETATEPARPVKQPVPAAQAVASDACPASLARTRRPYCHDMLTDGSKGPVMVVLPTGSFRMGSDREASEQPVHTVTIARHFAMSAYEVSVADYRRFCQASGRHCVFPWSGDKDPVVNVSWKDVRSYTNWLSSMTGKTYRLPTEAEWEYAARARTTGDYPFGDGSKLLPSDARFNTSRPLPVDDRSVNANGFRLRHILGNVSEWVEDAWFDNYQSVPDGGRARTRAASKRHVVRGGSFADPADRLRPAARAGLPVDTRDNKTGFRLVREIID